MSHKRNENRVRWRKIWNAMHPQGHKAFAKARNVARQVIKMAKLKRKQKRRLNS